MVGDRVREREVFVLISSTHCYPLLDGVVTVSRSVWCVCGRVDHDALVIGFYECRFHNRIVCHAAPDDHITARVTHALEVVSVPSCGVQCNTHMCVGRDLFL